MGFASFWLEARCRLGKEGVPLEDDGAEEAAGDPVALFSSAGTMAGRGHVEYGDSRAKAEGRGGYELRSGLGGAGAVGAASLSFTLATDAPPPTFGGASRGLPFVFPAEDLPPSAELARSGLHPAAGSAGEPAEGATVGPVECLREASSRRVESYGGSVGGRGGVVVPAVEVAVLTAAAAFC